MIGIYAAPPDLKADPKLAKPITLHAKMTLLGPLLAEIKKESGVTISASDFQDREVTVLVHDCPAYRVLEGLAEVTLGEWKTVDGSYRLQAGKQLNQKEEYFQSENDLLLSEANARLDALGWLVQQPYQGPLRAEESEEKTDSVLFAKYPDESPSDWAKRHINGPLWWTAGVAIAKGLRLGMGRPFFRVGPALAFTIRDLTTPAETRLPYLSAPFPGSPIRRQQIVGTYSMLTGELRVADPASPQDPEQFENGLLRYPRPPKALAKTSFAEFLQHWETPGASLELPKVWSVSPSLKREAFFSKQQCLDDHLEELADCAGQNVISDSYRVPCATQEPIKDKMPAERMKQLKANEKC